MRETALGVRGAEGVLVGDLDADETVGEVGVSNGPVAEGPVLVGEDDFYEQHVGEGVADGLVDEVADGGEGIEGVLLRGRLGLGLAEGAEGMGREEDRSVAVGLEVDANVELEGLMMEMLHASGSARNGEMEVLLDVGGASAVGVGGLDDADAELFLESSRTDEVADERRGERGDAVTVEHEKAFLGIDPVVYEAVGVSVEGAASDTWRRARRRGRLLAGLDKIRTALRKVNC